MNYELALKLKNAGFPQMGDGFMLMLDNPELFEDAEDQTMTRIERSKYVMLGKYNRYGEDVYDPTLEDLIEACGECDFVLMKIVGGDPKWEAKGHQYKNMRWHHIIMGGKTPQEAVARLWLALNKKA